MTFQEPNPPRITVGISFQQHGTWDREASIKLARAKIGASAPQPPPPPRPPQAPQAGDSDTEDRQASFDELDPVNEACAYICCCCCILPVIIILIILPVVQMVYLRVQEGDNVHYSFDEVSITGLEPSALNASLSTGTLSIGTSFRFRASNRHPGIATRFSYYDIDVTVETLGLIIGYTHLTPFELGHKSTKYISGGTKSGLLNVSAVPEAGLLAANESGNVQLIMKVLARASWPSRGFGMLTSKRRTKLVRFRTYIDVSTSSDKAAAPKSL